LFASVAAYVYEADPPLAARRAPALTLDRDLLRELLGEGELRELLSIAEIAAVELELQRLTPERAVTRPDGIVDLLRDLGPLTIDDIGLRTRDLQLERVFDDLVIARRLVEVR